MRNNIFCQLNGVTGAFKVTVTEILSKWCCALSTVFIKYFVLNLLFSGCGIIIQIPLEFL